MTGQAIGDVLLHLRWTVPDDRVPGFEAWYDEEHLADMVDVPGILGGRRFARVENAYSSPSEFNFLTLYQLAGDEPLRSDEYNRLSTDPSPWTLEAAMGLDLGRTVFQQIRPVEAEPEHPAGPALFHVLMRADAAVEDDFTRWYDDEHLPAMLAVPGVLGARRFRAIDDDAGFGVHPAQADHPYLAVYELASLDVVGTAEFKAAGKRTPLRERLGDAIAAHVQTYRQVFPGSGAYEGR
ncbi:hypothetical protein OHA72_47055 [Dactylosporangium sp. NBC_01737]|uniref:hypothetical protein n=1 Tax=Dactylosporangium sp. NBC_01737 TaxID=2975959 RepID=UPI002E0EBAB1|nr:hypothetical protein OHA72_47055 [Dactylosporangium sp. NBC_01737]